MSRPLVVAHRGASSIASENTLEAFEAAMAVLPNGPFEVESACLQHPAVREAAALAPPYQSVGW